MRMKVKKILSVLLALCLLLGPAPAAVLAAGSPPLTGTETVLDLSRLTGENVGVLGEPGGKWYYNAASNYIAIYGKDDHGAFTITGEPGPGIALKNIEAWDGIDLIFDRAKLTLAGGSGWTLHVGANNGTVGGSLTLRDSDLTVDGRGYDYTVRTGITGSGDIPDNVVDVILDRSTLTATGDGDAAVYISGGLTVKNGSTLKAMQAGDGNYNADIRVQGDMVVDGSDVFTSSGKNRNYGIYVQAGGDLTVTNGGAVTVSPAAAGLYGIYVWEGDMRVDGGSSVSVTETAAGSGGININAGLLYGGGLSVEDSSLEASGEAYGISLGRALSVVNGDVIAQGTGLTGTGLSGGLDSSIDGLSEVTLTGGHALDTSFGRTDDNDFTVKGGTVKLEGEVSWNSSGGNLVINGGSVEISDPNYPRPQHTDGTPLYKTALTLDGAGAGMTVSGSVTTTPSGITYSLAGAKTDGAGKVYVWLPEETATAELAAARQNYSGAWTVTTGDTAAVTIDSSGFVLSNNFVLVLGGTSSGEVREAPPYAAGELVTLTAGPASPGQVFRQWQINPNLTLVRGTLTTPVVKFFMPGEAVTAAATYEDDPSLTYTAGLSPAGVTFPVATAGYGAQAAQTFTVTNTGTGELKAAGMSLSDSAFVKEGTVGILAPGETAQITVRPVTGLAAGTYTDTLTISLNHNITLTAALSFTVNPGAGDGDDGDGDGNGGGSGSGGTAPSGGGATSSGSDIPASAVRATDNGVTVQLGSNTTRVAQAQMETLISANREQPVVISGSGYTFTFPRGTMTEAAAQQAYDFGLTLNAGPNHGRISALAQNGLVLTASFNHSGPLPAEARITFQAGAAYAGQTLYYYYYNGDTGNLEYLQSAIVQADGTVTVRQSHCSDYVLTQRMLTSENVSGEAERISGEDRYATAVRISKEFFSGGADTVILARGDSPADALPAVPLAKQYSAPLLLTPTGSLPAPVLSEIRTLGARNIILIGGTGAIGSEVEKALQAEGLKVERLFGGNRYDTAYAIASKLTGGSGQAVLVNGDQAEAAFADALSVAAWAGSQGIPILYADSTSQDLPAGTAQAFTEQNITRTILIGGTAMLPATLEGLVPNPVRYSGGERYATNAAVLKALQPDAERVYAATGRNYADALAAAAAAAQTQGCLILVDGATGSLIPEQENLLRTMKGQAKELRLIGGPAAVPASTAEALRDLLGLQQ